MTLRSYDSWGRLRGRQEAIILNHRVTDGLSLPRDKAWLAFGNGRSYGDCCLNDGGVLIDMRGLDRFIAFDSERGVLRCEAGVLFSEVLDLAVPRGWFPPVTPGTQFVTVGGAIANDVHGKNHHVAGTFGCHVRRLELLRSDGTRLECSLDSHPELFRATIGGLGLTGIIQWAEFQLRKIESPWISVETVKFDRLEEFFQLAADSDGCFEHTVAWIDCLSAGEHGGRGHFVRGNHAPAEGSPTRPPRRAGLPFPFDPPFSLVNGLSLRTFNTLYFHRQRLPLKRHREHFSKFFYPLDAIENWNRIYGRRGFFQFQCCVPTGAAHDAIATILRMISKSGQGSFLAVLKIFGDVPSPGMLSFPRPGATLALDFPNLGPTTRALLASLEAVALESGGALYPAKDACMSPETFRRSYPRLEEFSRHVDPQFSSSFMRRVHG